IKNLQEWKRLRDAIFKNNLAKGAVINSPNGINKKAILDNKYDTYWTTKDKDTSATIVLTLKNKSSFNVLMLQEDIAIGQRIENLIFEYWNGKQWKNIIEGTTVGYKRLWQFPNVTTNKVRLKIISSRLNPTLSEMGLYLQAAK
ncbi:MAG TPA: discoidin domain-containing protein, partial [Hanamia sp.]|nr:discoidin domain-containing protein [Hanamia sp.]